MPGGQSGDRGAELSSGESTSVKESGQAAGSLLEHEDARRSEAASPIWISKQEGD
jgi:hypothetical protein